MNTPHTPTSTSSERTLIAAIIDGHAPDILSSDITEDWFFDNNTKAAFAAAKRLFETSSDITEISVATELNAEQSKIAVVDQSDSDHYVAGLPYGNVDGWRAAYDICRTKAFQRDMIHSTRELLEALQRPNTHVNGVVSAMEDPFAKLMNFNISDEGKSATAEIDEFIQEQMDEAAGKVEAVPHEFRLYTGMPLMEDIFEPIDVRRRDNHIVIGAPSSTGKSALMRQIIMKNLEEHDDWVIVMLFQILQHGSTATDGTTRSKRQPLQQLNSQPHRPNGKRPRQTNLASRSEALHDPAHPERDQRHERARASNVVQPMGTTRHLKRKTQKPERLK